MVLWWGGVQEFAASISLVLIYLVLSLNTLTFLNHSVLNVHRGDINIDSDSSLHAVCILPESVPRQRNICIFHRSSYFLVNYTESHRQVFL